MSDDELPNETLEKLDASTLWLVRMDLLKHMRGLEALAKTGVLSKEDCTPRADTLRAMAAHYKRWWEKATNHFDSKGKEFVRKDVPHVVTKPARDFLAQTISFALDARPNRGQGAEEIRLRIKQTPAAKRLLAGHAPTAPQIADALSAHSRGPNPRYIRVARGKYQNNPKYKKPK